MKNIFNDVMNEIFSFVSLNDTVDFDDVGDILQNEFPWQAWDPHATPVTLTRNGVTVTIKCSLEKSFRGELLPHVRAIVGLPGNLQVEGFASTIDRAGK